MKCQMSHFFFIAVDNDDDESKKGKLADNWRYYQCSGVTIDNPSINQC